MNLNILIKSWCHCTIILIALFIKPLFQLAEVQKLLPTWKPNNIPKAKRVVGSVINPIQHMMALAMCQPSCYVFCLMACPMMTKNAMLYATTTGGKNWYCHPCQKVGLQPCLHAAINDIPYYIVLMLPLFLHCLMISNLDLPAVVYQVLEGFVVARVFWSACR